MGGIDEEASAVSTGSELQSKTSLAGKMEFFSESSECSSSEADDDIFGASSPDKDLAVRAETTTAPAVAPTHPPGSSSSAANVAVASSPEVGTNSAPTSGASTLQPAASAYTLELDALPTLYSGIPSEIPAEFMDAADAFSQSLPSPSKSVAARRPVATVFGSDAPAEAVGASAQDEGDADDEFDYDTKDDAAMPQFHQHSYRPAAPPAHIVTDLRSMPLGALKEEEEEEEENAAEPAAELQSGGPKGHAQDAAAGDLPAVGQLPGGDTAADQTMATAAAAQDAADARQLPGRFQPAPPGSPRLETRLSVGTPLELESPKHHRAFRTVTSRYRRPVDGSPSSHDGSPQRQNAEEGLAAGAPHEEFRGELVLKDVDLDVTDMEEGGSSGSPKKGAKARRKASQTSKAEEENAEGMASPKLTRKTSKSKGGGGSSPKLGKKASSARRKELIKELLQNMKDVHSTFAQAEAIPELKAEDVVEVAEVKIAPPPKPATKAPAAAASPPPTAAAASENRRSMDPPHPSPRAQAAVDTDAAAADDSLAMEEEWERANEVAASSWMEGPMTPRSMLYGETIHYFMTMDLTHLIPSIDEERWQPPKLLDILLCRGPVPLQQALHLQRRQLMCLAKQPLNDSHPRHVQTLLTVFSSYTGIPLEELKRYGDHWSEFGFQGRDPATDLRAGGMLSLLQLYALRIHNPDNADAIYALSRDPRQEFPMAPVGVNITTWTLAAMRQGLLSREANRRQSMVETSTLFYVGCFYELHARWKARNHTMADSGHVLEALEKYCLSHTSAVIHRAVSNSLH